MCRSNNSLLMSEAERKTDHIRPRQQRVAVVHKKITDGNYGGENAKRSTTKVVIPTVPRRDKAGVPDMARQAAMAAIPALPAARAESVS